MSSEIKADKWSPASGTSATIGDSGDTYTVPSGVTLNTSSATLTLPSTVITGQTAKTSLVDADKFIISDSAASGALKYVESQYIGGGTLVQVGKNTLGSSSGSIIVDNCFTSTYTTYMIVMRGICNDADGNSLKGRFRTGGGSGSSISSTHYRYACRYFDDDGNPSSNTGVSQAQFQISNDSLAGARYLGYSGVFYIHQPHSTSFETRLHGQASFVSTSLSDLQTTQNAIHLELTTSVTGIELFYTGGNVESNSQIVVYGVNVT